MAGFFPLDHRTEASAGLVRTRPDQVGADLTNRHDKGGGRRIVSEYGRWFEDFAVGDIYEHRPGRTVTEADNIWFSALTMNLNPLHVDSAFMARTEFGRPLMNSALTLAIVTGLSVRDTSGHAVANLGWDKVRLTAPVFAGDTLYAESEVLEVRPSRSRPGQGIVRIRSTGTKADGTIFMTFERAFLVPRRDQSAADRPTPRAPIEPDQ